MIELEALWGKAYRELITYTAHETKGMLNGITLNLEVLRTRSQKAQLEGKSLAPFAEAAYAEQQKLSTNMEAHLWLSRLPKTSDGTTDVALTLKHLATMLLPAARAEGISLTVEGYEVPVSNGAPSIGVRLALASGLFALIKEGGGTCVLETGPETVVRFSHQSATAVDLDSDVSSALAKHGIKTRRSPQDLQIVFP